MIRRGFTTNEVMVVLVTNGNKLPNKDEFVQLIVDNIPGIKSIVQNVNSKPTNVILGQECITLWLSLIHIWIKIEEDILRISFI